MSISWEVFKNIDQQHYLVRAFRVFKIFMHLFCKTFLCNVKPADLDNSVM